MTSCVMSGMPTSHLSQTSNTPSTQHSRNVLNPCNKHRRRSECPTQGIRLTSRRPPCLSLTRSPKSIAVAPSSCLGSETVVLAIRSHVRCLRFLCPHFSPPRPPLSWRRPLPGHMADARVHCPTLTLLRSCSLARMHLCSDCCLLFTIHCRDSVAVFQCVPLFFAVASGSCSPVQIAPPPHRTATPTIATVFSPCLAYCPSYTPSPVAHDLKSLLRFSPTPHH